MFKNSKQPRECINLSRRDYSLSSLEKHKSIHQWVKEKAALLKPDHIKVATGTEEEFAELTNELIQQGALVKLTKKENSFLAFSDPSDVARVEKQTYICSENQNDAGPTNNWKHPTEMMKILTPLFDGSMKGRTMYVVPFSMGPIGSPFAKYGIQLTDSPYVVCNMKIMTRMGTNVLNALENDDNASFIPCIHTVGAPLKEGEKDVSWPCNSTKYIVHFPDSRSIYSFGSGYGGNALLGKKCLALRIASVMGREEGWLAEHMLILAVTNPQGEKKYFAAAFPSACGKTNLAMLNPTIPGWKVETVGDDIAWIRPGEDGRLYAINPEFGFFGVAPGTSMNNNPNAILNIQKNTLFTNVALTEDGDVWWEGLTDSPPPNLTSWKREKWDAKDGPAAHPNSRFTTPISQSPTLDPDWQNPNGVPISAFLFGGRRKTTVPLVTEAFDWSHGTFIGASISSEQTAAAEGKVGSLRHDPFAMLPFCGYNMADYMSHWLSFAGKYTLPKIYYVNWFRCNNEGKYLWPGFGENSRVLKWIFERTNGQRDAVQTPIGYLPKIDDIDIPNGTSVEAMNELLRVDIDAWKNEVDSIEEYLKMFGSRLPNEIEAQIRNLRERLNNAN